MSKRSRYGILIIAGILLAILYSFIFRFSEQTGEESGSLSYAISRFGVELWDKLTGGKLTEQAMDAIALYFEHPLRKAAHFAEYAVMGILVCSIMYCLTTKKGRCFALCLSWVALSAAADELHQYFVPGRCGSVADVILDTVGGGTGIWICYHCLHFIFHKRQSLGDKRLP